LPIIIPDSELTMTFVRASGPGGQNVNKVSTAAQLRFDVGQSRSLPPEVRQRLLALAGSRATQDGVLIITSRSHRTQEANRVEARARLDELVARAEVVPKTRRPSRPTLASKVRRLAAKSQRSSSKKLRGRIDDG
jgi:ribosome-associated protein